MKRQEREECIINEIVSMIRKYHNHKPQTTPWHREEESLNHRETPGRQIKQRNQLSLTLRDVCYNARWFWTIIRYGPMTTAYQCWTTGNLF